MTNSPSTLFHKATRSSVSEHTTDTTDMTGNQNKTHNNNNNKDK